MSLYNLKRPCKDCPFLREKKFRLRRLEQFASAGEFVCHKTAEVNDNNDDGPSTFEAKRNGKSSVCAGMLIYNEKRGRPNQMMRVSERLGLYDPTKLEMDSDVV